MPRVALVRLICRELLCPRTLPREPEPDLVMQDEEQVRAYSLAGRIDGVMAAAYLFHSGQISAALGDARRVLDLACGPATQLGQVASLNPQAQFTGVDLSETMLESARKHVAANGLTNVEFRRGDICDLSGFDDASVDAVISTMALHHLPTKDHLDRCFSEISRVLRPGGAVYLTDFARLKSLKSVIDLAYMNGAHQPHIFSLDYERSLRAAFLYEEFGGAAREYLPESVRLYGTFMVPLLVILRTPFRPLAPGVAQKLADLRKALPRNYAHDFEDLRRFFRAGGLRDDPFRSTYQPASV